VAHHFGALEIIRAAWQPPVVATDTGRVEPPGAESVPATPVPEVAPPKPIIVLATPPPQPTPPRPPVADRKALALNPTQWPRQVSLTQPQTFPALLNGKVIGSITVPAGTVVKLLAVQENALIVEYQGARHTVTTPATDLIDQVLAARALPVPPPVPVAAAPRPEDASAYSHLISAKPPYSQYNEPLAFNPDFPPSRNPAYLKMAQLMAQRTGETKPLYRPLPLNFVACIQRYSRICTGSR